MNNIKKFPLTSFRGTKQRANIHKCSIKDTIKNEFYLSEFCKTIALFIGDEDFLETSIIKNNLQNISAYELSIIYNNIVKNGALYNDMILHIITPTAHSLIKHSVVNPPPTKKSSRVIIDNTGLDQLWNSVHPMSRYDDLTIDELNYLLAKIDQQHIGRGGDAAARYEYLTKLIEQKDVFL